MPLPYPLIFEPILLEKVWGGTRLGRYGKHLPQGRLIGESWEVADLESTSTTGAGGAAARSVIANGALRGRTLSDAMALWGDELAPAASGRFPLLVKYLDARENLSVQVHPSPAYAAANPGAHPKTEAWYVVEAEPDAKIYAGLREGIDPPALNEHLRRGTLTEALNALPAIPGDCHILPSGTCHALGAGILVAEVQTPSDTTFRLWDWGRTGRELHLQQAIECIAFSLCRHNAPQGNLLACTEFFTISRGKTGSLPPDACGIVMMVRGEGRLTSPDGSMILRAGDTAVVPAACAQSTAVEPRAAAEWLTIGIP
jgi:mannose-6-phosphate isomerase